MRRTNALMIGMMFSCLVGAGCDEAGNSGGAKIDPQSLWLVQPYSATVMQTKVDGSAWDLGTTDAPPDPYAELTCPASNPSYTYRTNTVKNTFDPIWTGQGSGASCVMTAGYLMNVGYQIGVYDEDVLLRDTIAGPGFVVPTEADLNNGYQDLSSGQLETIRINYTRQ